jgi:hypothetical protein
MEFVTHHVSRSGNKTLLGFFHSDAVDFDPPSKSLRLNIMKAKAKVVYDLANGFTDDSDERSIRDLMKDSPNSYELIRLVDVMEGWEGMDDELEPDQVDAVAFQIAQVLDQRDYVVYQLIRRYLSLLDYDDSPTLGDCFRRLLSWPVEFQADEINFLLFPNRSKELLKRIASATMRGRTNMVNAAQILPPIIQQYMTTPTHRNAELLALMYQVNYTTRICNSLVVLDYQPLYSVITDLVDPLLTNLQRTACRDTCDALRLEFAAAAKAVEVVGSNEAKVTVNRFMAALHAALVNFPPTLPAPAPTAISAIIAALGGVGNTLSVLLATINGLPDALSGAITISNIFGADRDDKARQLIGELATQGSLARLAFTIKLQMVNWLLTSPGLFTIDVTTDDEENAINSVLQAAKDYDQAELYQLARGATWESLDSNIQGDEFDQLLSILGRPV